MHRKAEPKKVRCARCGYETRTRSKLIQITCASCGYKTKNTAV